LAGSSGNLRGELNFMEVKMEERIKIIEKRIREISAELEILEREKKEILKGQQVALWTERRNAGWQPFIFYSSYYGSECGKECDKLFYVFSPTAKIDVQKWQKIRFSHGDSTMSETNKELEKELEKLDFSEYDYIDDDTIQAVWPELYRDWRKL